MPRLTKEFVQLSQNQDLMQTALSVTDLASLNQALQKYDIGTLRSAAHTVAEATGKWDDAAYLRYLDEVQQAAQSRSVPIDKVDLSSKAEFVSRGGTTDPGQIITTEIGTIKDIKSMMDYEANAAAAAEEAAKPMDISTLPGGVELKAKLDELTMERPEFNPEAVTQWKETLTQAYEPYVQEAQKHLRGEFAAASPYSYGSGSQMRATSQLAQQMYGRLGQEAIGLAERDVQRAYDLYQQGLMTKVDLAKFLQQQSTQEEWQGKLFDWEKQLTTMQRGWQQQDWERQAQLAQELAKMYESKQPGFWDYMGQAVGTGLGYAVGGPLGAGVGSLVTGLFGAPTKSTSPYKYTTGKLNVPGYPGIY